MFVCPSVNHIRTKVSDENSVLPLEQVGGGGWRRKPHEFLGQRVTWQGHSQDSREITIILLTSINFDRSRKLKSNNKRRSWVKIKVSDKIIY